jgi:2-polyprenyl-3-methyl-5-hydroxy-6-metoxy-1,4-benzoquinol methylase
LSAPRRSSSVEREFGPDYYRRYYFDSHTAVTTRAQMHARARFIAAYVEHAGLPVRRILDAGCGTGMLRMPLKRALPRAQYVGLEASEYLCQRLGWEHGQLQTYTAHAPFDLVICYDVLQYLSDHNAARALANLTRLCRGVLYFSALTLKDWRYNCDQSRTDRDVHLREGLWYRKRLRRAFREVGAGLWLRRGAPVSLWELETV